MILPTPHFDSPSRPWRVREKKQQRSENPPKHRSLFLSHVTLIRRCCSHFITIHTVVYSRLSGCSLLPLIVVLVTILIIIHLVPRHRVRLRTRPGRSRLVMKLRRWRAHAVPPCHHQLGSNQPAFPRSAYSSLPAVE